MRFGLIHRLLTSALAVLGLLALVSSGQFGTTVSILVLATLTLALFAKEEWTRRPSLRHLDSGLLIVILGVQIVRFALGAGSLDVLIEFAAAIQIVRLMTRRGAAHDQQVIVLSLLHLIAGTVLGGGIGYGLCLLGVVVIAPGALVLSHLRREVEGNYRQGARDRTGLPVDVPRILRSRRVVGRSFILGMGALSLPILLFTAILFLVFPRVGLSLLLLGKQSSRSMVGFSDRVDLGQVGRLREDRTVALRVRPTDPAAPRPPSLGLHLRGAALDHYDSRGTWTQTEDRLRGSGGVEALEWRVPTEPVRTYSIELEPIDPPVLFLPEATTGVRLDQTGKTFGAKSTLTTGPDHELRYQSDARGVAYSVTLDGSGRPSFRDLPRHDRRRYLALPEDLLPAIAALAEEWTSGESTPRGKAEAIEARLKTEYRYDRDSPSTRKDKPLEDFLFESKRGHCTFFSSALAIMLRTQGVPTRNVNGFSGGVYNKYGDFYVVRQGDAHSWVEVFEDGEGWVTFDATPAAGSATATELTEPWSTFADFFDATSRRWNRNVVEYDLDQQVALFDRVSGDKPTALSPNSHLWTWGFGALLVGVFAVVLYRWRPSRAPPDEAAATRQLARATTLYGELEIAMELHGVRRPVGLPPLRHAENLREAAHPIGEEVLAITEAYLMTRFGHASLSDEEVRALEGRVRAIRERAPLVSS